MSQSPAAPGAGREQGYQEGWDRLLDLVQEGRSWSGHERNCAYLNARDESFRDVSSVSGFDFPDDGRALVLVDWDADGDLDVWTSNRTEPRLRYLRNDSAGAGDFVAFRLLDKGANREAIGARIEVRLGGASPATLVRGLRAGEGFLSQSSRWLHFGLGEASLESVVVRWPGGEREEVHGATVGGFHEIERGRGRARAVDRGRPPVLASVAAESRQPSPARGRSFLPERLPLPRLSYRDWDGREEEVSSEGGNVLLNLSASWCAPCRKELAEWTRHQSELRAADLEILVLSVDGLAPDDETAAGAMRSLLGELELPFASGRATAALVDQLQRAHDALHDLHLPLPVPTSVLLDGSGRLAAIYEGPVSVATLQRDVALLPLEGEELLAAALPQPGRWLSEPAGLSLSAYVLSLVEGGHLDAALDLARRRRSKLHDEGALAGVAGALGEACLNAGRYPEAVAQLRQAVESGLTGAGLHRRLGLALEATGEAPEALRAHADAVAADPTDGLARLSLGHLLARAGHPTQALPQLRAAVQLRPEDPQAWFSFGAALAQTGQVEPAAKAFEEALRLDPGNEVALDNRRALESRVGVSRAAGD